MLLAVANKPVDTGGTYTVGADVSRFQRSSVPSHGHRSGPVDERVQAVNTMASAVTSLAGAISGRGTAPASQSVAAGPVVRVARGNNVTVVPVGAK